MKMRKILFHTILSIIFGSAMAQTLGAEDARLLCQRNIIVQGQSMQLTITERLFIQRHYIVGHEKPYELQGKLLELHKLFQTPDGNNHNDVIWRSFEEDTPTPLRSWQADIIPTGKTNELLLAISDGSGVGLLSLNADRTATVISSNIVANLSAPIENKTNTTNMWPKWTYPPSGMLFGASSLKDLTLSQNKGGFTVTVTPTYGPTNRLYYSLTTKQWTVEDSAKK